MLRVRAQARDCVAAGERAADPVAGLRLALAGLFALTERSGWVVNAALTGKLPESLTTTHRRDPREQGLQRILRRAVAQGQLRADLDVELAAAFLTGTLLPWKQSLIRAGRTAELLADAAVDLLLAGRAPVTPSTGRRSATPRVEPSARPTLP